MFCEECGGIMLPKNKRFVCQRCGFKKTPDDKDSLKQVVVGEKKEKVLVLDDDIPILPVTRVECPECQNMDAYWWLIQTRRADEPETRFLRCTKCKFTWREYD
jgi:DNA-directed RNA polymerase subunit M